MTGTIEGAGCTEYCTANSSVGWLLHKEDEYVYQANVSYSPFRDAEFRH